MLFIVSVIFCVVSVWLVMEPWVKFGTTGTAKAVAGMTLATAALRTDQIIVFFMTTSVSQLQ
jgi:hypothetical protein